jgi:hypothetical protein
LRTQIKRNNGKRKLKKEGQKNVEIRIEKRKGGRRRKKQKKNLSESGPRPL